MSDLFNSLPKWQWKCKTDTRVVGAFEIKCFSFRGEGGCCIHPMDSNLPTVVVTEEFVERQKPDNGGYLLVYPDGALSCLRGPVFRSEWCLVDAEQAPAEALESGYALIGESESSTYYDQLCKFYDVQGRGGLIDALLKHIDDLQEAAKRNVKPWEDTFPPTLLPAYIQKIDNGSHMALQSMAAQIAGIKDEVADFMAGLDGALMSGKSVENLCDELQERIALYDTHEAVDLFMNLVKTREAGLPDGLTPEAIELLKGLPFPHRRIAMVFDAPNLGDGYMVPEVVQAFNESHRRSDWGKYPFTASNDITINVINLSAGGSPGEIGVEPPLQHVNKTNQQGQIELLTAALDAARHELDGKYISANATVIDAYQMPADGSLSGFTEWSDKVGFTEYNKMRLSSEGKTLEVNPGDWVVTYLNAEPGRMVFNSFEPEIFEALYTSAAELLK